MKDFDSQQSFRKFSETISNKSYFELLEKYILLDKTSDLDKKHKEWSNTLMENQFFTNKFTFFEFLMRYIYNLHKYKIY